MGLLSPFLPCPGHERADSQSCHLQWVFLEARSLVAGLALCEAVHFSSLHQNTYQIRLFPHLRNLRAGWTASLFFLYQESLRWSGETYGPFSE